jgi:uncharacterized protein with PQ loop repeat
MHEILVNIFGMLLIFTGTLDAIKYLIQGKKIAEAKSAKNFSRSFVLIALTNDIFKLIYGCVIYDAYIILTSLLALFTIIYMFYQIYLYYPYKYRNLNNFKRPNIFIYTWNSLLPNTKKNRL